MPGSLRRPSAVSSSAHWPSSTPSPGAGPWTVGRIVDTAASVDAGYRTAFLLSAALLGTTGLLAVWRLRPERDALALAAEALRLKERCAQNRSKGAAK
ncbi:hypothetical protein O1M54_22495 [Streptomyces diastatochromogenes]|nr:hypothetical protein [Streptomyces diastatochromogenes]